MKRIARIAVMLSALLVCMLCVLPLSVAQGESVCVAKIGQDEYASLQAVITAAVDSDIIVLQTNWQENVEISGKKLTLELGGYTLTSTGAADGAFLSVTGAADVTVRNGTLAGAVDDGGNPVQTAYAVYVSGSAFTLDKATISGHSVATSGGGIYADASAITLANGAVVTGNAANGTAYTRNTGIVGNGGGGIFACNGSAVTVDASTISNNTAAKAGGGVFLSASTLTAKNNASITGNHAAATNNYNGGGAIYSVNKSVISLDGSHVDNNTAAKCGAAIAVYNGPNFGNAEAPLTINNSTISGNATTSTSAYGGIYLYTGARSTEKISITGTTFDKNESTMHCALYIQGGGANYKDNLYVTIKGSTFSGNKVNSTGSGSIVNVSYSNHLNISDTLIDGNTGGQAPLYMSNCGGFVADRLTISNNTAYNAGGVYMMQCNGSMSGSSITGNASTNAGNNKTAGGVAQQNDTSVSYTGCRISGNTSAAGTGGILVGLSVANRTYHVNATMTGTVVTGNTGAYMGGITYIGNSLMSGSSLTVKADSSGNGAVYGNTCTGTASGHDLSITPDGAVNVMAASAMKDGSTALKDYAFISGSTVYPKDTVLTTTICEANGNTGYTVQPYVERFVAQNVSGGSCAANEEKYTLLGYAIAAVEGEEASDAAHVLKLIAGENDEFGAEIMENVNVNGEMEIQLNERTLKASTGTALTVASGAKVTLSGKGTVDTYQTGGVAMTVNGECTVTGAATIPAIRLGADKSVAVTADAKIDKVYLDATVLKSLNLSAADMSVILFTPHNGANLSALASSIEVDGINALVTVGLDADGNVVASCKKIQGVFVDGVNGKNTTAYDGLSPDKAKKTIAEALKVLEANPELGGIYVVNTVTLSTTEKWDGDLGGARLKRYPSLTGAMISIPSGYTLSLSNVVVDGNSEKVNATDAMISVSRGGTLNITDGAELRNNSRNNSASRNEYGGAVISNGTVNMTGGKVSGNNADQGGGICMYGSAAKLTLSGGSIENNTTNDDMISSYGPSGGGVLLVYGADMDMSGGTVSGNEARYGAGIAVGAAYDDPDSAFTMTGGTVKNNQAIQHGGGIFIQTNCTATISGGSITGNSAAPKGAGVFAGGGIYVNGNRVGGNYNYGELYLTNAIITDNTAGTDLNGPGGGGIGGCGTSITLIYNDNSAAIYGNTGMDLALKYSTGELVGGIVPQADIAEFMLGGGAYSWTDGEGVQYTSDELDDFRNYAVFKSNPTQEAIAAAQTLGKVVISGNSTGGNGGGIGSNGTVIIGAEKDVVDLTVTKAWNEPDNEEQLTEQDGKYYLYPAEGVEVVHPESFRVWLLRDGERVSVVEFEAESGVDESDKAYLAWPKTLTFNDLPAGDHTYTVEEEMPDGAPYFSVVSGSAADGFVVTNSLITPCSVQFSGTKTLTGKVLEAGQFSFELLDGEGNSLETVQNTADGAFSFTALEYDLADVGNTYTYMVQEVAGDMPGVTYDETLYTVTVEVTDNGDGTLTATTSVDTAALDFTNVYSVEPTSVSIPVKKVIEIPEGLNPADITGKFTFTLEAATEGAPMPAVISCTNPNADGGTVIFGEIEYTEPGIYEYTVTESGAAEGVTNDAEATKTVTVTVVDNGDGTLTATATSTEAEPLTFINPYSVEPTSVQLAVTKELTGREMKEGEFSFELKAEANGDTWTKTNAADGSVTFDEITCDEPGVFTYVITEVNDGLGGVVYDEHEVGVTVTVVDNGDGTLTATPDYTGETTFVNAYSSENELELAGAKVITGREFKPGDVFTFELVEDGTVIQRYRMKPGNGYEAAFAFLPITFTNEDVGTRSYVIREAVENISGVTYDETEYAIDVTVTDNGAGELLLDVVCSKDGETADKIVFTNVYSAEGEMTLTASKTVNGAVPTQEQVFSFILSDENGEIETVQNTLSEIAFTPLTYTLEDVGTHTYTVHEAAAEEEGYTSDATVYTIEATVTDNGDGTLKVEKVITAYGAPVDSMTFDNAHSAKLTISKQVTGCTTDMTFPITVWLYGADGSELQGSFVYTGDVSGTLTSGETIQLGDGQTAVIVLPVGASYKVEEATDPRFATTVNTLAMSSAEGEVVAGGNTAAFVNALIITEFSVRKEWHGIEGGQIRLTLFANGEQLDPQPEYEVSGYVYTYRGLPKYDEEGDEIVYTAKEKYMDGYLTIYSNVAPHADVTNVIHNDGTIINRAVTDFKVQKVWDGLVEGEEAPQITLTLYCNGEVYERETPEPNEEGWYCYKNLPAYVNGEFAVYSVVEEPLEGCRTTYDNGGVEGECAYDGGVITNTIIPKTGDSAPIALWTASLLASAAVLLLMLRRRTA